MIWPWTEFAKLDRTIRAIRAERDTWKKSAVIAQQDSDELAKFVEQIVRLLDDVAKSLSDDTPQAPQERAALQNHYEAIKLRIYAESIHTIRPDPEAQPAAVDSAQGAAPQP